MTESKQYTWEPITIKPGDQSLVGEVVKEIDWQIHRASEVEDVGRKYVFLKARVNIYPGAHPINNEWLIRREVKKKEKKVWAFGMIKVSGKWGPVASRMFESINELKANLPNCDGYNWPAKMTSDGTFEEPEDNE